MNYIFAVVISTINYIYQVLKSLFIKPTFGDRDNITREDTRIQEPILNNDNARQNNPSAETNTIPMPTFAEMKRISLEDQATRRKLAKQQEQQAINDAKAYQEFLDNKVNEYETKINEFRQQFKSKIIIDLIAKFYKQIKHYLPENRSARLSDIIFIKDIKQDIQKKVIFTDSISDSKWNADILHSNVLDKVIGDINIICGDITQFLTEKGFPGISCIYETQLNMKYRDFKQELQQEINRYARISNITDPINYETFKLPSPISDRIENKYAPKITITIICDMMPPAKPSPNPNMVKTTTARARSRRNKATTD